MTPFYANVFHLQCHLPLRLGLTSVSELSHVDLAQLAGWRPVARLVHSSAAPVAGLRTFVELFRKLSESWCASSSAHRSTSDDVAAVNIYSTMTIS
ncbi:hypothetical protein EVAR_87921_1 [Eumeta japonica]|uniref:Uncharacterized protein n=1 Tax=Eumeta variegata TaxID=151549 RepID=A0A4C1WXL6_EUMVA|nr:hypothetical protein EVAR_87921_1 [Eumeta japonica]